MKEGGLGDVKFTLVSYLPRYPTDLMFGLNQHVVVFSVPNLSKRFVRALKHMSMWDDFVYTGESG